MWSRDSLERPAAAATCAVQCPTRLSINSLTPPIMDNASHWQRASVTVGGPTHADQQPLGQSDTPICLLPTSASSVVLHGKRKMSNGYESACPRKVFVNEERMSARLHDLHLDNNNVDLHPDLEQAPCYSRRRRPTDEGQSSSVDRQQTLELCQDLQLGLNTKQLLPQLIIDELNKPSLQVVLWKPRPDFVRELVTCSSQSSTSTDHHQHHHQHQQPSDDDDDDDVDNDVMTDDVVTSRVTRANDDDDMDL